MRGVGSRDLYEKQLSLQVQKIEKLGNVYLFVHLFWKTDLKVSNYLLIAIPLNTSDL